ncbi:hypothetical protein FA15DRAFT_681746 [Coprinopsis marcescibilis]|uniref:CxC6 like cysteine cluster associated with KDZ domain-containing protein n=1 Tax=Coprinopsis marcescibilis TaxID=230819 RepID=A0A5C3KQC1_COPMA|nr:hypothetical protein FA15DRAFT_681746 [Coprinopsis marcescibilis]
MNVIPALYNWLENLPLNQQESVQFHQILQFIVLAARMKDDILLTQPSDRIEETPPVLPPSIQHFLATACTLNADLVPGLWTAVSHTVWTNVEDVISIGSQVNAFVGAGYTHGLVCEVDYHHSYSVHHGTRTYYRGVPSTLQIGEHHFAEVTLINSWIMLMLIAWVSASNSACFYNSALSENDGHNLVSLLEWQFKGELTGNLVYSGFTILSLLEDMDRRNGVLVVSHEGIEGERFLNAVHLLNDCRRLYRPEVYHTCDGCTRHYEDGRVTRVVVSDGVTLGRPCCGEFNCKKPLANNRHQFCPEHAGKALACCVHGCNLAKAVGRKTCTDPAHQAVEDIYRERGTARFQLQSMLKRAQVGQPERSAAAPQGLDPFDAEALQQTQPSQSMPVQATKRIRAQFGRSRTHNEQLIVAPCGMIIAQETFYGAEGVASVVEFIKQVYRVPGTMPNHIFYDNNCTLSKMVNNPENRDPAFANVGLSVDVFHFKCKHSVADTYCQVHCNPAAFPELLGEDDKPWFFNSSVAEQTNAWIGGYLPICREMTPERYDFFLAR